MTLETWACTWLVDHGISDDGEPLILDCSAPATERLDGSGWDCAHGHEYTTATEYYDADEAAWLRSEGHPVAAGARLIDGSVIR